ncbi:hypothetical protein QW180_10315 [Vibrio sinaloensis]|nr:hypothetical protein [Vibrio sinaloensis]
MAATGNQPPFIVESVYQQLTQQVANWTIREGQPMRLQLNVANLFDDPDNDLLTTRVELNLNGGKVSGGQTLTIYGAPKSNPFTFTDHLSQGQLSRRGCLGQCTVQPSLV